MIDQVCSKCKKAKPLHEFGPNCSLPTGLDATCKICKAKISSLRAFVQYLRDNNKQWNEDVYMDVAEKVKKEYTRKGIIDKTQVFKRIMHNYLLRTHLVSFVGVEITDDNQNQISRVSTLRQSAKKKSRKTPKKDNLSDKTKYIIEALKNENVIIENINETKQEIITEATEKTEKIEETEEQQIIITRELIDKWGDGYEPREYLLFENKYNNLKNSFQLQTESHKEFLRKTCVCSVKADMAMARGDVSGAKHWIAMFKDMSTSGKITPAQMSKADLSGGLDTFGQLARHVETHQDIIPLLPKYLRKPQDDIDFTILCYVNYERQLHDLPLCKYEDIYKFIEDRKKDYNEMRQRACEDGEE